MNNPSYDFKDQVALVTGAGSGMGLVTAKSFAEAGAAVVLADIDEGALRAARDELSTAGHQVTGVTCDVADEAQAAAMVERAVATFGRLDAAFNNAVCPGTIDTPMVTDMLETQPDAMAEIMRDQPIGRLGRSDEIVAAVLWLCSPAASFVVGVALPVDGGFTAH